MKINEIIAEHIVKLPNGKYQLRSRKKTKGKTRNLGTFRTRAAAEKHEREVEYFKHKTVEEGFNDCSNCAGAGHADCPLCSGTGTQEEGCGCCTSGCDCYYKYKADENSPDYREDLDVGQVPCHCQQNKQLQEALLYHRKNKMSLVENIYRPGSEMFFAMIREARALWKAGKYTPRTLDELEILESNMGLQAEYQGRKVWLDFPHEEELLEDKKKDPTHGHGFGKPFKSGSGGAVYVHTGKGGVKKVNFSQSGMTKKYNDPARVRSFVARHHCKTNNDKTSASYWACRWPRYFSDSGKQWW